jgi:gas vesicle protein
MSKGDVLEALGLSMRPTLTGRLIGTLGTFGVGLLVGAGAALLLAPRSGRELRGTIATRLRTAPQPETLNSAPPT